MTPITDESYAVGTLHEIARWVEKNIGTGQLSGDIRDVADRLNEVCRMEAKYGKKGSN